MHGARRRRVDIEDNGALDYMIAAAARILAMRRRSAPTLRVDTTATSMANLPVITPNHVGVIHVIHCAVCITQRQIFNNWISIERLNS